jgi:hypothetical protein
MQTSLPCKVASTSTGQSTRTGHAITPGHISLMVAFRCSQAVPVRDADGNDTGQYRF